MSADRPAGAGRPDPATTFRQAGDADLPAICALGLDVNNLHHDARPDIYAGATSVPERDRAHWQARLSGELNRTFIAERHGRAVGFITVRIEQQAGSLLQPLRYARIGTVGVDGASRGQGIGRVLMQLAEDWAVEQGARDVRLTVWNFNSGAIHLYQELGYATRALEMGKPCGPATAG